MKKNIILLLILIIFLVGCEEKPIGSDDDLIQCETDNDCIPLPSECHPRTCINKKYEDNYIKPEICTMMHDPEAAYNPEDCICKENKCVNKNSVKINLKEAREIAQNSVCTEEGKLTESAFYNENTKTWWIDLEIDKEGCAPACVVDFITKTAEINWRCTGLLPPESKQITEEKSKEIAKNFILNSETYKFDGFDLSYKETTVLKCPYCWQFIFEFQSRAAGYGDRTGMMLAQVITPHRAVVTVIEGEVTGAVLDDKWDMLKQELMT